MERLLRARQDKVCRAPGGFKVQEAEGQQKEGLWRDLKKRTELTGEVTPVPPLLDIFGHFPFHASNRCHCSRLMATLGTVKKWMWEHVEMLTKTTQYEAKIQEQLQCWTIFKSLYIPLPSGKPIFCSAKSLFYLHSIKPCVFWQGLYIAQL